MWEGGSTKRGNKKGDELNGAGVGDISMLGMCGVSTLVPGTLTRGVKNPPGYCGQYVSV